MLSVPCSVSYITARKIYDVRRNNTLLVTMETNKYQDLFCWSHNEAISPYDGLMFKLIFFHWYMYVYVNYSYKLFWNLNISFTVKPINSEPYLSFNL